MTIGDFSPEIKRVDKINNRHGLITDVIYYYPVGFKQLEFIQKTIQLFENTKNSLGLSKDPIYILTQLRRIRRTKEYRDNDRELLSDIRNWYIQQTK